MTDFNYAELAEMQTLAKHDPGMADLFEKAAAYYLLRRAAKPATGSTAEDMLNAIRVRMKKAKV